MPVLQVSDDSWSEPNPFRIAGVVDQAEVVIERRTGIDTILVVKHIVDVNHDLLGLCPGFHSVQIVARIADADRKLLRRDRPERGGPSGLGDDNLTAGIFCLDLVVSIDEGVEA
jgi:hypothetical protein